MRCCSRAVASSTFAKRFFEIQSKIVHSNDFSNIHRYTCSSRSGDHIMVVFLKSVTDSLNSIIADIVMQTSDTFSLLC